MSQVMSKLKQFASNLSHKPSKSTSRRRTHMVRDSHLLPAGTFTRLNISAGPVAAASPAQAFAGVPLRRHHPLMLTLVLTTLSIPLFSATPTHATASNIGISISGNPTVDVKSTPGGTFADSGNSTITVTTNHASGYTLTAKAANATSLAGTKGGNLATLDNGTAINADTFSNASNTQYNDKWGYKPSKYNSVDNTTASTSYYYPSPGLDTASSPLDTLDTITNSSSSPYTYTVSIGARVTTATAIDSYSNSFIFAVVGNPTPYAITYNKNTTDTVSNMPANHTTSDTGAAGETVTLATNTPTRTGFSFTGWCTVTPTTSAGVDSCTGTGATTYAAGGTWTINQTSITNSLNLYAMWTRASYNVKVNFAGSGVSSVSFVASGYTTRTVSSSGGTASLMYGVRYTTTMNFSSGNEFSSWALNSSSYGTLSSTSTNPTYFTPNTSSGSAIITATGKASCTAISGTMQNFSPTSSTCTMGTLTDSRDNQSYTVAKLADGKWWMTTNMNIAGRTVLSSTDTDFTSSYTLPTTNGWTVSGGKLVLPASSTSFGRNVNVAKLYNSGRTTCSSSRSCYSYYSWDTATLGSGRSISTDNANAPYSICPKNWHLPSTHTGTNSTTDFRKLMIAYGGSSTSSFYNSLTSPTSAEMFTRIGPSTTPNFLPAGVYFSSSFQDSSYTYYWSSTIAASDPSEEEDPYYYARVFMSDKTNFLYTATGTPRYEGIPVRCLFSS